MRAGRGRTEHVCINRRVEQPAEGGPSVEKGGQEVTGFLSVSVLSPVQGFTSHLSQGVSRRNGA